MACCILAIVVLHIAYERNVLDVLQHSCLPVLLPHDPMADDAQLLTAYLPGSIVAVCAVPSIPYHVYGFWY